MERAPLQSAQDPQQVWMVKVCEWPSSLTILLVVCISGAQKHESVADEGYRPSEWELIRTRIEAGDLLAPLLERLLPGEWLNNEVINRILPSFPWTPDVRVLNTFFLDENWTPQPDRLSRELEASTTQLIVPVCRLEHWTLLHVFLKSREINHYDSLSLANEHGVRCRLMAQAVDQALNAAERGEWKFRANVEQGHVGSGLCQFSLQQSNTSDCGALVLYNAFCLSRGINPRAYSFNPDEWRLKLAKKMMQPGGSPELTAGTESENASGSSEESIEEEAQNGDDEGGEEDGGDSGEEREVGENEVGSGEEVQVEPVPSGGISCPHPLREIF